jgi:hypothetical protein
MTPQQAYEWLAPKLSMDERKALDVIFAALPNNNEAYEPKYGCHCDLDPGQEPDECVLDEGRASDCVLAERLIQNGKGRDDCAEWRIIERKEKR